MDELSTAGKIIARKLANKAVGSAVSAINPFDAAPDTLQGLGEIADTIDAPRKYFIDNSFNQMDFNKSLTGQPTPGIEYAKNAADLVLPSAYDLLPGAKEASKAAQIVERKTAAEALKDAGKSVSKTLVLPNAQELSEAKTLSNKVIVPTPERSTAQIILERQSQKPVSLIEGPVVKSSIVSAAP